MITRILHQHSFGAKLQSPWQRMLWGLRSCPRLWCSKTSKAQYASQLWYSKLLITATCIYLLALFINICHFWFGILLLAFSNSLLRTSRGWGGTLQTAQNRWRKRRRKVQNDKLQIQVRKGKISNKGYSRLQEKRTNDFLTESKRERDCNLYSKWII